MNALWMSLKKNYVHCGTKRPAAAFFSPTKLNESNNGYEGETSGRKELVRPLIREAIPRQKFSQTRLYELDNGDASRNVVEIIFRNASINHYLNSALSLRIQKVLRVKNPTQAIETFETYRDKVKEKSHEEKWMTMHPRNAVDGNELLRFFSTTAACCGGRSSKRASELCEDPSCELCCILESNFETEKMKKKGIRLSSCSEGMREKMVAIGRNVQRAVIVCRVIAGMFEKKDEVMSGSVGRIRLPFKLEYLIVRDPTAVLPCFVMIFS